MKIDIDEVFELEELRKFLNRQPLDSITWTQNGEDLPISIKARDTFETSGLSNIDYVYATFT